MSVGLKSYLSWPIIRNVSMAKCFAPHAVHHVRKEEAMISIGVDVSIYFYLLVTMDLTRKQCTNTEPGKALGKGPMHRFAHIGE
jgi:hypothetical protein